MKKNEKIFRYTLSKKHFETIAEVIPLLFIIWSYCFISSLNNLVNNFSSDEFRHFILSFYLFLYFSATSSLFKHNISNTIFFLMFMFLILIQLFHLNILIVESFLSVLCCVIACIFPCLFVNNIGYMQGIFGLTNDPKLKKTDVETEFLPLIESHKSTLNKQSKTIYVTRKENDDVLFPFTYVILLFRFVHSPPNLCYLLHFNVYNILECSFIVYLLLIIFFKKTVPLIFRTIYCSILLILTFFNQFNTGFLPFTTVALFYETTLLLTGQRSFSTKFKDTNAEICFVCFLMFICRYLIMYWSPFRFFWFNVFFLFIIMINVNLVKKISIKLLKAKTKEDTNTHEPVKKVSTPVFFKFMSNFEKLFFIFNAVFYFLNEENEDQQFKYLTLMVLIGINFLPLLLPKLFQIQVLTFTSIFIFLSSYFYIFFSISLFEIPVSEIPFYAITIFYTSYKMLIIRVLRIKHDLNIIFADDLKSSENSEINNIFKPFGKLLERVTPIFEPSHMIEHMFDHTISKNYAIGNYKKHDHQSEKYEGDEDDDFSTPPQQFVNFLFLLILSMLILGSAIVLSTDNSNGEISFDLIDSKTNNALNIDVEKTKVLNISSFFENVFQTFNEYSIHFEETIDHYDFDRHKYMFQFNKDMTLKVSIEEEEKYYQFSIDNRTLKRINNMNDNLDDKISVEFNVTVDDFLDQKEKIVFHFQIVSNPDNRIFQVSRSINVFIENPYHWKISNNIEFEIDSEQMIILICLYAIFFGLFNELFEFNVETNEIFELSKEQNVCEKLQVDERVCLENIENFEENNIIVVCDDSQSPQKSNDLDVFD
eukprot:TRINITY_DN2670_c0_g3_i1.p1 TRINITY_DN2670_c0_g3~~TRINITY_DN2670_c0_g3_i1.p1  ORF type:complete len:821 (+),score=198.79 TRINITY_DN2670_c0_g3_i1:70-2532(+)